MGLSAVPKGFRFAGLASGIKKKPGVLDLGLIVSDPVATCAGGLHPE